MPNYLPVVRQMNIGGQVKVELTVDEKGNVASAKAVSGPQLLRGSSEDAARKTKFKPALVDNQAVKATGYIIYNFTDKD